MSIESSKDKRVQIEFTPAQQEQVFKETGKSVDGIELSTTELEERIAPRRSSLTV